MVGFRCGGIDNYTNKWGNIWGNKDINDSKWHHVVGVYDGKGICIFVDGILDFTLEASGRIITNNNNLLIGTNPDIIEESCWNGLIDDIRIYSKALSLEEISAR